MHMIPSELDAQESCNAVCANDTDCAKGEYCWVLHENVSDLNLALFTIFAQRRLNWN